MIPEIKDVIRETEEAIKKFFTFSWLLDPITQCFCCKRKVYRRNEMRKQEEYAGGISSYLVGFYCLDCAKDHPIDYDCLPKDMDCHTKLDICAENYFKYYDKYSTKRQTCPFTGKFKPKEDVEKTSD